MVSILSVFIVPLYINLQRGRILLLSFLPILIIASSASVIMIISYFWDSKSFSESIGFAIYIFFAFLIGGYIMMLPILIFSAFIVEYLRVYQDYSYMKRAIVGGLFGATMVTLTYSTWKFIWVALVSGFLAVLLQYYLIDYKKSASN